MPLYFGGALLQNSVKFMFMIVANVKCTILCCQRGTFSIKMKALVLVLSNARMVSSLSLEMPFSLVEAELDSFYFL